MISRLALLSGALFVLSFPKFGHPAFGWIALAPLLLAITRTTGISGRRGAFAAGWLAGVTYFGGSVYWVVGVMQQYGGLHIAAAVPVGFLLVAYLAIFPAVFASVLGLAVHRFGPRAIWAAPVVWVVTEWARATLGGGFPWVPLGASQAAVLPVVQAAAVVGVYGLSALLALVSVAAVWAAMLPGWRGLRPFVVVALVVVGIMVAGTWRIAQGDLTTTGELLRVGLVQGNVPQDQKYDPAESGRILDRYVRQSREVIAAGAEVVVWPEASTPFYLEHDPMRAAPIRRLAAETSTPFVIGTDEYEPPRDGQPERFFNAASLIGTDGQTRGSYRKMHLVPFGEYVPLKAALFFVKPLIEAVSDFSPGVEPIVFDTGRGRMSVAICYESVFPSLARDFVNGGSQLLATITNDAWFGWSSAAYQHFDLGALRAVEQGRYLVRAANTGVSGAVDPYGRVLQRSALFEPATLTVDVRLLSARTIYNQIGDVVVWASLAATVWLLMLLRRPRVRTISPEAL